MANWLTQNSRLAILWTARLVLLLFALISHLLADTVNDASKLLNAGKMDEAVALLQKETGLHNDAALHNLLCRAYYAVGKTDLALKSCEQSVRLELNNSRYHLWLGRAYGQKAERSGWYSAMKAAGKIRENFEKALALNPDDLDARSDLAEYYIGAPGIMGGGKNKARELLKAVEVKAPAMFHWIKAHIAEEEKNMSEAETEFKAVITASGDMATPWIDLAGFYRRQKRFDEMETAAQKSMQAKILVNQDYFEAANLLLEGGRNFPQAMQWMNKYLASEMVEDAPAFRAHYLLGRLHELSGDKNSAGKEYAMALALVHGYKEAQDALQKLK